MSETSEDAGGQWFVVNGWRFYRPPIADHRPLVLRYDRFYVDRTFWKSNYNAGAAVRAFGSASTIACHLFKQQFALQVICHERMDDLQTEAAALFRGEVGGQPQTVVQQRYAHFIPKSSNAMRISP